MGLVGAVDLTDTGRGNLEPAYYWWHLTNMEQWLISRPHESLWWKDAGGRKVRLQLTGFYWNYTKGFCLRFGIQRITSPALFALNQLRTRGVHTDTSHMSIIRAPLCIWIDTFVLWHLTSCSVTPTTKKHSKMPFLGLVTVEWPCFCHILDACLHQ